MIKVNSKSYGRALGVGATSLISIKVASNKNKRVGRKFETEPKNTLEIVENPFNSLVIHSDKFV